MTRQFITLSDKIFIEIFYWKYLYLQILFDKFSKDAFSVWLCIDKLISNTIIDILSVTSLWDDNIAKALKRFCDIVFKLKKKLLFC